MLKKPTTQTAQFVPTLRDLVAGMNRDLKLKKNVLIDEVGTLLLDVEQRIQFEPSATVNYLLDSYGLPVFQKQPIKRITTEDKITKEFKDRTAPLLVAKKGNATKKWLLAAAITIPLAFFAIWIPTQYDLTGNINYANLNPFKSDAQKVYKPNNEKPVAVALEKSKVKEQIALADENTYFLEVTFDKDVSPFVVKLKEKPAEAEAVSTYVATADRALHYHIIGGCFSKKNNAKKLVKQLKAEGFNASIIGKRKGLWTVCYSSFATRKEAVVALSGAKAHNSKAWVLNY